MAITIRPISTDEELVEFSRCQSIAFGDPWSEGGLDIRRALFEFDRSTAAFDGERIVGTAGIFSMDLTVPGGRTIACAGVTMVSVLPSHRRRGVLTRMMHAQLEGIRERGEALAALWASESIIYGRFGYGMAAEGVRLRIDRERTALEYRPATRGDLRYVEAAEARENWPAIFDAVRVQRPGWMSRSRAWWSNRVFADRPERRGGATEAQYVQYEVDGEIQGYLRYRKKAEYEDELPTGLTRIEELVALNDEAYAALWQFAFGLDLVSTIEAWHRPVDEPLRFMLSDPRRLKRYPSDSLWVRVLDVERALEGRSYSAEGSIVLEIVDSFLEGVGGRFLLDVGPGGARCTRTDRPAELTMTVTDLGSLYLSGTTFTTLARATRLVGSSEAIARADRLFAWPIAPWTPEVF